MIEKAAQIIEGKTVAKQWQNSGKKARWSFQHFQQSFQHSTLSTFQHFQLSDFFNNLSTDFQHVFNFFQPQKPA